MKEVILWSHFKESFIKENFPDIHFIQDNESKSSYGVLRGLDVTVDLRKNSPTYEKWKSIHPEKIENIFIPNGFAH